MKSRFRIYMLLFTVSVITAGTGILFLSITAQHAGTKYASEYPAPTSNDSYQYALLAQNLVEHQVFSESTTSPYDPDTFRTPGYPLFIAPFYAFFHNFYPVLIGQIVIVFLTSLLVLKMGAKMLGSFAWGLAAALLFIIDPNTILSASILLSENLFLLFFLASLYTLFFAEIKNSYAKWVLAAFLLALSAYIRPAVLYLPVFLLPAYYAFYCYKRERLLEYAKYTVLFLLVYAATLAPWYLRNHAVSGAWGMTANTGFALFNYDVTHFLAATTGRDLGVIKDELRVEAGLPPGQEAQYRLENVKVMQSVAFRVIASNPLGYAKYSLTFVPSFFVSSGLHDYWRVYADMMPAYITPEPSLGDALNPFSLPLLIEVVANHGWFLIENIILALVTLLAFIAAWRSKNAAMGRVFLVIVLYFILVTGPIAHARYRIPVGPLILIAALSATAYGWEQRKDFTFFSRASS